VRVLLTHTAVLLDRPGGSERVVWHLARGLRARGHDVRVVARALGSSRPGWITGGGVEIFRYPDRLHSGATLYLLSIVLAARAIRAVTRGWVPDVVHAHHSISALGGVLGAARAFCYTFYGPWHLEFLEDTKDPGAARGWKGRTRWAWRPAKAQLARGLERLAVRRSRRIVVLSEYSRRQVQVIHAVPPDRVRLIPGGVDIRHFVPPSNRRELRARLGLPEARPVLFTVRRLVRRMGLDRLTRESGVADVLRSLEPSWLADDASPGRLASTIARALRALDDQVETAERCRAHAERYAWERLVPEYETLYAEARGQ